MANGFQQRGQMYTNPGDWPPCAACGEKIDELPFNPRRDENGNVMGKIYHRQCLPPKRQF